MGAGRELAVGYAGEVAVGVGLRHGDIRAEADPGTGVASVVEEAHAVLDGQRITVDLGLVLGEAAGDDGVSGGQVLGLGREGREVGSSRSHEQEAEATASV